MLPSSFSSGSQRDTISLIQALVSCRSITPNPGNSYALLEAILRPLGFSCTQVRFGDVTNFYARLGQTEPHLCFAGHVDVVPPGDEAAWTYDPFGGTIADESIWGRGVADMLGGIACFVSATQRLLKTAPSPFGSLSFLLTSDEEGPATHGLQKMVPWLQDRGEIPGCFLVGEPTGPVGELIKIGRRGSLTGTLQCYGTQGHIAYPEKADNPIPRLVRCVQELIQVPLDWAPCPDFPPSHLEITSIDVGNSVTNVIPATASARFGVRFNPLHTGARLQDTLQTLCDLHAGPHTLDLTIHGEPFLTQDTPWIETVIGAMKSVTGKVPRKDTGGGTSDGRFLIQLAPVIECGLPNTTIHQIDEHVSLKDLALLESLYEALLKEIYSSKNLKKKILS